jgi:hypothetical protein
MVHFRKYMVFLFSVFLAPFAVRGQEVPEIIGPREYGSPSVLGMNRSRGIVARYEVVPDYRISSRSTDPEIGGGVAEIRRNNRLDLRAFVPVLNRPALKVLTGFNYFYEDFRFEQPDQLNNYPYYANLHEKRFRSVGAQLVLLRSLGSSNYFLVRARGNLNGDFDSLWELDLLRYTRYSLEGMYGWQRTAFLSYGIAFQVSYNFGRYSALPAILYNQTFNEKWGIEAIFPARVLVRHNLTEKTLLYAGYGGESNRYQMQTNRPGFAGLDSLAAAGTGNLRFSLVWDRGRLPL